ncbi:winged helix DNA-binding domain-containing protein [Actinoplanes sp. GCM10030250]|uniref:winged helix DNA-binding domain-containing protein n=1 Tax=Actinoplanes sp. GCM10030250 TaxID=3273376 RepID=UPI00361625B6
MGLWSRLENYTPEPTGQLLIDRAIVRMALMRSTIHLVTADDCRWLRPLVEPVIVRSTMGVFGRHLKGVERERLVAAARAVLAVKPMIFSELGRALAPEFPGHDPAALAQAVRAWLPLVQVPPRGVWGSSGRPAHVPIEQWLGGPVEKDPPVDELFRRYLAAFGPATVRDAQQWSGLTKLAEVADRLRPALVTFRDEQGRELFDLPDASRPDAETPAPVRFLYDFDNLLLSHADRSRVVTVDYTVQGWGGGNMEQPRSILVDGFVAATWKITGGTLTVRPFRSLTAGERAGVEQEGAALLAFHAPRAAHEIVFLP